MKNCLFCNSEFEPKTPKKKFCSDKCRVYFSREENCEGGFIYCLKNPINENKVFYIGKTVLPITKRFDSHIVESKKLKTKKDIKIQEIMSAGESVEISLIEYLPLNKLSDLERDLCEREKYWIRQFAEETDLVNKIHNDKNKSPGKSAPMGVRFDISKTAVLKKEQNLTSYQQVLDFLFDNYGVKHLANNDDEKPIKLAEISNEIPPMPIRKAGEDALDFAARKNAHKKKYQN